jgi:hypothetical protein
MKRLLIFSLAFASLSSVACTCGDCDGKYDLYRYNKGFVGKVTAVTNYVTYQAYTGEKTASGKSREPMRNIIRRENDL